LKSLQNLPVSSAGSLKAGAPESSNTISSKTGSNPGNPAGAGEYSARPGRGSLE